MSHHQSSADQDIAQPAPWDQVWVVHHADLLRYVTSLLGGDTHTAEDVVQETAMRLWQRRDSVLDGRPLGPWLRTVARNIVIDRHRRRRARPPEAVLAPGVDAPVPGPTDEVESALGVDALLADLSAQHRAAVLEVYVLDQPVLQAARHLGVPTGTVKSRCHHALRRLREQTPYDRCA